MAKNIKSIVQPQPTPDLKRISEEDYDKYSFTGTFLAATLAITAFKQPLQNTGIDFYFFNTNFYVVALLFAGLVGLSTYIFALSIIRSPFRKVLKITADNVYIVAILSPLVVGFVWVVIKVALLFRFSEHLVNFTSVAASIIGAVVSVFISLKQTKNDALDTELRFMTAVHGGATNFYEYGENAFRVYKDNNWAVRDFIFSIESTLLGRLRQTSTKLASRDLKDLVAAAVKAKILVEDEKKLIVDLARRQAAGVSIADKEVRALQVINRKLLIDFVIK